MGHMRPVFSGILENIEVRYFAKHEEFASAVNNGWLKQTIPHTAWNNHSCCVVLSWPEIKKSCCLFRALSPERANEDHCGCAFMSNSERWGKSKILECYPDVWRPFRVEMEHRNFIHVDVSSQLPISRPFGGLDGLRSVASMNFGTFPKKFSGPPQCTGEDRHSSAGHGDNDFIVF